jgi:large subunit ribosomal protein L24
MNKIKKEDTVEIITGAYKGQNGRVVKIYTDKKRALVEGINKAKKHMKPSQENPQGGIIEKELSVHLSNLALMHKGKKVKVGYKLLENGKRVRINKANGSAID